MHKPGAVQLTLSSRFNIPRHNFAVPALRRHSSSLRRLQLHCGCCALLRHEFSGYTPVKFRQDVVAGFAVTAVALPLAMAFAVASGANAGAGLVTAIVAGFVIGGLSGAPYQVLSLRGTPLIDTSGLQALAALHMMVATTPRSAMLRGAGERAAVCCGRLGLARQPQ